MKVVQAFLKKAQLEQSSLNWRTERFHKNLYLFEKALEVLASRLKEKKCLSAGTKVTFYCNRESKLLC